MKTAQSHNAPLTGIAEVERRLEGTQVSIVPIFKSDIDILYSRLRNLAGTKVRSRAYLNWVKKQPCCVCGRPADDGHHVFGSFGSLKTSDLTTIPVCRTCHNSIEKPEFRSQVLYSLFETMLKRITEDL